MVVLGSYLLGAAVRNYILPRRAPAPSSPTTAQLFEGFGLECPQPPPSSSTQQAPAATEGADSQVADVLSPAEPAAAAKVSSPARPAWIELDSPGIQAGAEATQSLSPAMQLAACREVYVLAQQTGSGGGSLVRFEFPVESQQQRCIAVFQVGLLEAALLPRMTRGLHCGGSTAASLLR